MLNREDLKAYNRTKIIEGQTGEKIPPEADNQSRDEMIDSLLIAIDDLALEADFVTPDPLAKKYISPYQAFLYLLRKSDKATQAEVLAGLNDSKFITPKGLANTLLGAHGLKDYVPSLSYAFGNGCFFDDGHGFKLYRCTNVAGTTGVFNPIDWELISGGGETFTTVIQKEFTLDFDATEDTFEKTHSFNNDYITYSIRKSDGSYYKETEYDVISTTTTFTVSFVAPPASGTGKLTLQSIQKEAVVPPEDEGFPYTLPLTF